MSLPLGLLGLLSYKDSTGYDLTRTFSDSLNNFWHAQSSQVYRELKRMEKSGWVTSSNIVQDGRPNKRLYTITDTGRKELAGWLAEARPEIEHPHHAMVMRVFFGAENPEATAALLRKCIKQCRDILALEYSTAHQTIAAYAEQIDQGQEKSMYWEFTLELGIAGTKTMLDWAEKCLARIEKEMA
jgi:DNA-binding PadR family transcriptional regulator